MYQIFGTRQFLRIILYLNAVCAVAIGSNPFGLLSNVPYLKVISLSVILVTALLTILGQTPLFPKICRLPLVWRWLPDISGSYAVEVLSNWPIVSGRVQGDTSASTKSLLQVRQGTAEITARLFSIRMRFHAVDEYSTSDVVVSAIGRATDDALPTLSYVFKGHVPVPDPTDSGEFFGAGRIEIPRALKIAELFGTYWTNRSWQNGLNTAGRIRLTRV